MLLVAGVALVTVAGPASAQEEPVVGAVDISFDVGSFDGELGDWTIDVVVVSGELEVGAPFTVELLGEGDAVIWAATQPFTGSPMRISVDQAVAVGDVTSAGVAQAQPIVGGVQVQRPPVEWSASGGGGSGQLALSMVLAIIVVAVVFRTPMPSASTQRWTR